MRIGVILELGAERSFDQMRGRIERAESVGLDLCLVRAPSSETTAWSPLALAAAAGAVTADLRIAVQVPLTGHPVELAEELAVADLAVGGRLVAALDPAGLAGPMLDEYLDIVLKALAPRPFTHHGERWVVPRSSAGPVRVTPAPAQHDLPLHLFGASAIEVAHRFGLAPVVGRDDHAESAAELWNGIEAIGGPALQRSRRMAIRAWPDPAAPLALVTDLARERDGWGLDTCVLDLTDQPHEAQLSSIDLLARFVRPRLQLHAVPPGLSDVWDRRR